MCLVIWLFMQVKQTCSIYGHEEMARKSNIVEGNMKATYLHDVKNDQRNRGVTVTCSAQAMLTIEDRRGSWLGFTVEMKGIKNGMQWGHGQ